MDMFFPTLMWAKMTYVLLCWCYIAVANQSASQYYSQLFPYQMVLYSIPLESYCQCLSNETIPTVIGNQMEELYSKYYIFWTSFSNISVVYLSNGMLLYAIREPLLMPIQRYQSHIPTIRNAKAIFKILHFLHLFLKYLGCFLIK